MKWAAVLALLLSVTSTSNASEWDITCRIIADLYDYSCDGISEPKIVYARIRGDGFYEGGDTIYINEIDPGVNMRSAIIHEQVHYLLDALGVYRVPGTWATVCASEDVAWKVSNRFVRIAGMRRLAVKQWWRLYKNCGAPK